MMELGQKDEPPVSSSDSVLSSEKDQRASSLSLEDYDKIKISSFEESTFTGDFITPGDVSLVRFHKDAGNTTMHPNNITIPESPAESSSNDFYNRASTPSGGDNNDATTSSCWDKWYVFRASMKNSFFARQLWISTCIIMTFTTFSFILTLLIQYGTLNRIWLQQPDAQERPQHCVIQPLILQTLNFLNVILGLPVLANYTSTHYALYYPSNKKSSTTAFNRDGILICRSGFLRFCETLVLFELLVLVSVAIAFTVLLGSGTVQNCISTRANGYILIFCLSICNYVLALYHLLLFSRFRAHQKMQLGIFSETNKSVVSSNDASSSQPCVVEPAQGTSSRRASAAVPSSSKCWDILLPNRKTELLRRSLAAAVSRENIMEVERIIANATSDSSSDFLTEMYATPSIYAGIYANTTLNPLFIAIEKGNLELVETLCRAGVPVNALDNRNVNWLNASTLFEYVNYLVLPNQEGTALSLNPFTTRNPNATSLVKFPLLLLSPLHVAVSAGSIPIVKTLVNFGANPDVLSQTSFLNTTSRVPPIFVADTIPMVKILLSVGANLLLVPSDECCASSSPSSSLMTVTVLQHMALQDKLALTSLIEEWGGDVALTPLHTAAAAGNVEKVSSLLSKGVFVDTLGEYYDGVNQRTPLHWASIMGRASVVQVLLNYGANVRALDRGGKTPLQWAARRNSAESVSVLLKASSDADHIDYGGYNIICSAASSGNSNLEIFQALVSAGADINDSSLPNGDSALHLAMKGHFRKTALSLLECGANINQLNHEGRRAIECTVSAELQFAVKKAAGANDILISYTPRYRSFALKVQHAIESNFITTTMAMDPHRDLTADEVTTEIYTNMRGTSVLLSILSRDYESSEYCINELALAKQLDIPVVGIFCDRNTLSEELQVYLYTRQIVPFSSTLSRISYEEENVVMEYDEDKFNDYLRCLLDGLRDEIEIHRLAGRADAAAAISNSFIESEDNNNDDAVAESSPRSSSTAATNNNNRVPQNPYNSSSFRNSVAYNNNASSTSHLFLSHGDCHRSFVNKLARNLTRQGFTVNLDSNHTSTKERIVLAKDSILMCSAFVVVLSAESVKSPLVSDQLAYAEDKDKPIIPILLNEDMPEVDELLSTHFTDDSSKGGVLVFSEDLGYDSTMSFLIQQLKAIQ